MNLLESSDGSNFDTLNKRTLKKCVGFHFTFSIYRLITVGKPFYKFICFRSWKSFTEFNNSVVVEHIGQIFFAIMC